MVGSAQANRQTLAKLLVVAAVMFGFGFAMVPFYRALCDAVGLNSVMKADASGAVSNSQSQVDATRFLTVEFDTNLRNDLPWRFTPVEKSVRIHPGVDTTLDLLLYGPTSRTDGTENIVGAIQTCMGVCGANTIGEFHDAELIVAPSIKTEGKVYQLAQ